MRVAVDVGGTFTDLLALLADATLVRIKVPTTPAAPHDAVFAALAALIADEAVEPASIEIIVHASTIATNALLGQVGLTLPRVAFITTAGFRDVLEIGRQNRSALYDLAVRRPAPLARREDRLVVRERREADGRVTLPLDAGDVERAIDAIEARGITTVAVGLLHAYVDDAHEIAIAERLAARLPHVAISRSADIVREYREYERFSTAVVNAALIPLVGAYLAALAAGVRDLGVDAPLFVMASDGGTAAWDTAMRRPARTIESGPAGGVIAAAAVARELRLARVLSFDMGGTTAKAGTVLDGVPAIAREFEAAGRTHSGRAQLGSGYPVRFPFVDLAEVSAGGGTIAWLDAAGTLRVGPVSAGADPGPAAYGRGERPTVTDANLVLGRLDPHALLGGAFRIDGGRAHAAIATVAAGAGGDVVRAAAAIVDLIDAEMAKVVRIVTVERGFDPRDFTLVAFGGGGPLHACTVAAETGVSRIIVPSLPGLFSAYGLLAADVRVTSAQSVVVADGDAAWTSLDVLFATLRARVDAELAAQRVAPARRRFEHEVDLRYGGQSFELTVRARSSPAATREAFAALHEQRYGFRADGEPIEVVTARVVGIGSTRKPPRRRAAGDAMGVPVDDARSGERPVWDPGAADFVATPVYARDRLRAGHTLDGPAIVEQYDTTTYVARRWRARVDGELNLDLAPNG